MTIDTQKLRERIDAAIKRITSGSAPMRVPADQTDPDLVLADAKTALDAQAAEIARLRDALTDATAHLAAAASAYRNHASRSKSITPRSVADPFFAIRAHDFDGAVERARAAVAQEQGESE